MRADPFKVTAPRIAASILSADFSRLGQDTAASLAAGADLVHLDVMDGHFVPNISFGPPVIKCLRKSTDAYFDVHLMIAEPLRYAERFVAAGADLITFHAEVVADARAAGKQIRSLGVKAGIAINPATPETAVLEALDEVDLVLVMSVVPGFSGQAFMPEVLSKAQAIKARMGGHQRLEMDGGLHAGTMPQARSAGVDWFVAASAIFDAPDLKVAVSALRASLDGVAR